MFGAIIARLVSLLKGVSIDINLILILMTSVSDPFFGLYHGVCSQTCDQTTTQT